MFQGLVEKGTFLVSSLALKVNFSITPFFQAAQMQFALSAIRAHRCPSFPTCTGKISNLGEKE